MTDREVIVNYNVTITKVGKDFYLYNLSVQPGGSKIELVPGKIQEDGSMGPTEAVEANPPTVKTGQALGIGQAMNIINDLAYQCIENAGMVK